VGEFLKGLSTFQRIACTLGGHQQHIGLSQAARGPGGVALIGLVDHMAKGNLPISEPGEQAPLRGRTELHSIANGLAAVWRGRPQGISAENSGQLAAFRCRVGPKTES